MLEVTLLTLCLGSREVDVMCRKNSCPHRCLELVNQIITFRPLSKPEVTKERSHNHSKIDQIIKPGDNLKDLGHPRFHWGRVNLTHLFCSSREELPVSVHVASHEGWGPRVVIKPHQSLAEELDNTSSDIQEQGISRAQCPWASSTFCQPHYCCAASMGFITSLTFSQWQPIEQSQILVTYIYVWDGLWWNSRKTWCKMLHMVTLHCKWDHQTKLRCHAGPGNVRYRTVLW